MKADKSNKSFKFSSLSKKRIVINNIIDQRNGSGIFSILARSSSKKGLLKRHKKKGMSDLAKILTDK